MSHASRRIDHVVVAVRDLESAGRFYQRLGFQVGARNRHPWGIENRLIQFSRSFIELITFGPDAGANPSHETGQFSFGGFIRDYLHQREGLAMLALDSNDAKADSALFSREGAGSFQPFFFDRKGCRPNGSETHVAFTLAFAVDAGAPQASFFVSTALSGELLESGFSAPRQRRERYCRGRRGRRAPADARSLPLNLQRIAAQNRRSRPSVG